jgi:Phosphofructokinase
MVQAFESVLMMAELRDKFTEFCIPMTVIPATISNNVPGTDFSLGADTSVNEIAEVCITVCRLCVICQLLCPYNVSHLRIRPQQLSAVCNIFVDALMRRWHQTVTS